MARKAKSRGRNLRRTETQGKLDVSRYVSRERGRADGREALSAVSASAPKLVRKTLRVRETLYMEVVDRHVGGVATMTRDGRVVMVTTRIILGPH